jgi:uncharacterized membrane-anchored protein
MSMTLTPQEIERRAMTAKRVKANPDFQSLVEFIEADVFNAFRTTNVLDVAGREEAHKLIYAIDLIRKSIERYSANDNFEKSKLTTETPE